jgi:hypothetical protein
VILVSAVSRGTKSDLLFSLFILSVVICRKATVLVSVISDLVLFLRDSFLRLGVCEVFVIDLLLHQGIAVNNLLLVVFLLTVIFLLTIVIIISIVFLVFFVRAAPLLLESVLLEGMFSPLGTIFLFSGVYAPSCEHLVILLIHFD